MSELASRVVEVIPISDLFCSGVHKIERLGDTLLRVWCYANQASDAGNGPMERVLVAKIIIPTAAMPDAIMQAMLALGQHVDFGALATTAAMLQ